MSSNTISQDPMLDKADKEIKGSKDKGVKALFC